MANSKKPRKRYNPNKLQTYTPSTIRYSKDEGDTMKFRIYYHIQRIGSEEADAGDFLALQFRFRIGLGLVGLFNELEAKEEIEEGLRILDTVKLARESTGSWQVGVKTQDQLRQVCALIDEIQDLTTRREQLPVFIQAQKSLDQSLCDRLP